MFETKKKYSRNGGSLLPVIQLDCSTVSHCDKPTALEIERRQYTLLMAVRITPSVKY